MAVCYLVRLPTVAFAAALVGLQQIHWERLYSALASIVGVLALLGTVLGKGNLITLATFNGIAAILVGVVSGLHLLLAHQGLRFTLLKQEVGEVSLGHTLGSGLRFNMIGVAAMIVWNTDNLVISYFLGPEQVTRYAITFKLFAVGWAAYTIFNGVIGPMYGKAAREMQWEWIKSVYRSITTVLPMLGGLMWIGGVAFGEDIIYVWAGPSGFAGAATLLIMGGYGYCLSLVHSHASLLSALNATYRMMWLGWAEAMVNLGLTLILVNVWGIDGVAMGTLLGALLTVFWALPYDVARQTRGKVDFRLSQVFKHFLCAIAPALLLITGIQHLVDGRIGRGFLSVIVIAFYAAMSYKLIDDSTLCKLAEYLKKMIPGSHFRSLEEVST
jgi:O-antigen/teichoic acid export membrane protein